MVIFFNLTSHSGTLNYVLYTVSVFYVRRNEKSKFYGISIWITLYLMFVNVTNKLIPLLADHKNYSQPNNKSNFNKVTKPQMYRVYKKMIIAGQ